jgi:hypothetical protein
MRAQEPRCVPVDAMTGCNGVKVCPHLQPIEAEIQNGIRMPFFCAPIVACGWKWRALLIAVCLHARQTAWELCSQGYDLWQIQ